MSQELINKITLDYLLNKEQHEKYIKQNIHKKIYSKDKKFYRKRIVSLTKELLLDVSCNIYPEVKYTFDTYINTCIHFFKSLDNNDIIQKELSDIKKERSNSFIDLSNNYIEANNTFIKTLKFHDKSLDKFVIKTKIGKNEIILPQKKNVDLKDPVLKTKGVKNFPKKKNITNIYEDPHKIEKEKNKKNKKDKQNETDNPNEKDTPNKKDEKESYEKK